MNVVDPQVGEPWVPYEQRGTRWYIWNELFAVKIPFIHVFSLDDIEHFGMPSCGDQRQDQLAAQELQQVMIPIVKMAELFDRGVGVHVVNYSDTKRIYDLITNHLEAAKAYMTTSLNVKDVPIDDLKLLDRLAMSVYEHAKYQFTDEFVDSFLNRTSNQRQMAINNALNDFAAGITPMAGRMTEEENPYPERPSMAQFFEPLVSRTANSLNGRKPESRQPARKATSMAELLAGHGM